ncbi:flagellar outer dynein arm light chain 5, thioredoxin-like protein [Haematococcus lacustris]|uniref:Thioredoxin domain-containing protein n=1 Tax=Haematococcus lacustris TaxID=44745 RepID=A0A699Z8C0_HAELA|nr:hypothetical protein QJQ45_016275 [Haematococcus lacustris]GFH18903.1 thioredoxin domain-containing protein [Haematococcus lacustris]GFH24270.1 thioredoxin domain-containing protein [Haematococcus lacustris]GFH31217.1 thioredoxin domain-containing protein [Haematococcus lacustris]
MAFQIDIKSSDMFRKEVLDVPSTCQVCEVYQGWAGPCKAIVSTFKRIFFDSGDRPLKFYTVDAEKVGGMEEYRGHCQPVFLFFKDGKVVDKVVGVIAPALERKIMEHSALSP